MRKERARMLVQVGDGEDPSFSDKFQATLTPILSEIMLASYLAGFRDTHKDARVEMRDDQELALSLLSRAIDSLKKVVSGSLERIEQQFNFLAQRAVQDLAFDVQGNIFTRISDLVSEGATVATAKRELTIDFAEKGLASGRVETLFRTSSATAYGAASYDSFQDPDIDEILWGYMYSAIGDDRTRYCHNQQDGVILPKDDSFWQEWWTPNGYNCRCQIIALYGPESIKRPDPNCHPDPGFVGNPANVLGNIKLSFEDFVLCP